MASPRSTRGTTRISASMYDRLCRLAVGYQSAEEDRQLRTGSDNAELIADAVAITRSTRAHPDVRHGASVRGAIDLVAVAAPLAEIRGGLGAGGGAETDRYRAIVLDAALLALSGRISVDETAEAGPEQIIRELWEEHFVLAPARAAAGSNAVRVPEPT